MEDEHKDKKKTMQIAAKAPFKPQTCNRFTILMIISCFLWCAYLIFLNTNATHLSNSLASSSSPTSLKHLVFGIASNEKSWPIRKDSFRLWWRPQETRGCIFLETKPTSDQTNASSLPPVCISEDTSRFRYTFRYGLRSAIRVARVVSETVALNHTNVRWFVFGDDDTLFFPENLVKTLSKYDDKLWYYIGTNSENFAQNKEFSYNMAFGGAGFAISYPLAKVLAKVLDSCIDRYHHLYGSDGRIHACITELGVTLTHDPGFHQMDIRGSMFGFLASHPTTPLISLHHWEEMEPIFPNMTAMEALQHLFQAVRIDSQRIMQQTVCYDRWNSWTISVSWGYAVQIFPRKMFLPDAIRTQETFVSWKRGWINVHYDVDTIGYDPDPCRRPPVFFLHNVSSHKNGIMSVYRMMGSDNCTFGLDSPRNLVEIRVSSHKMELDYKQLQAPRRQCCDVVLHSSNSNVMEIAIRECGDEELIYMH